MSAKLQPAFWGGLFIGVLSALPFIGNLNTCCCLWVVVGGALTTYLLQERTEVPVTAGDGALAGLLAGVTGALVTSVLSPIMALLTGVTVREQIDRALAGGDLPPQFAEALAQVRDVPTGVWFLASVILTLIVYPIFSVLGGLLGVAMFRRSLPPAPPPGGYDVLPPQPDRT
jgi:hypothetical protein